MTQTGVRPFPGPEIGWWKMVLRNEDVIFNISSFPSSISTIPLMK